MQIKELRITDFKGIKEAVYKFGNITKIMAMNGIGKTSIATAWYWLWSDKDYELHSNPNIRPYDIEECIPKVEAVLDINGIETLVSKQQKRAVSKPDSRGVSKVTLTNTYEINSVPKTERDFKAYLEEMGINFDKFLPLSHPDVFTSQKVNDMRKVLFEMAESKSDKEVATLTEGCLEVAALLDKYKFNEIEAMHKASKKKAEEQVKAIPNQIIGLEKAKVNYDIAELELQSNCLKEQISEKQSLVENGNLASEKYKKASTELLQVQFEINDINRKACEELHFERKKYQDVADAADMEFDSAERKHKMAIMDIEKLKANIVRNETERKKLVKEYQETVSTEFNESKWIFDEESTICPNCGQTYPEEHIDQIRAEFHQKKEDSKKTFRIEKQSKIEIISSMGMELKNTIERDTKTIKDIELEIEQYKAEKIRFNGQKTKALEKLSTLQDDPDLSDNQEYEALCLKLHSMEESLKAMESGADYSNAIKAEIRQLNEELEIVQAQIAKASNNVDIDEQITVLQQKQREYEQAKADSEKILYQLSLVSKKKNELLVGEINSKFTVVRWELFAYQKNGEYKECCIPLVDGKRFGESTNTGREIIAELDICDSLQKFFGINLPVFLDRAESINDDRIPNMDCQLVLLKVTEDPVLKLEVA